MSLISFIFQFMILNILAIVVYSTMHGATPSACLGDMIPQHPGAAQSNDPVPCTITAQWSPVLPDVVEVKIEALPGEVFRGFLLIAQMTGMPEHFVGKFVGTTYGHLIDCERYHANSGFTHSNGELRTNATAFWVPTGDTSSVTFRATIVGNDTTVYWSNVESNPLKVSKEMPLGRKAHFELPNYSSVQDKVPA